MKSVRIAALSAFALLGATTAAQAADIVNISAVTNGGTANAVAWTGGPGTYTVTAVGASVPLGSLYDAWSSPLPNCTLDCSPQWHWNFAAFAQGSPTLNFIGLPGNFASAGAALSAAQSAANWNDGTFTPPGPFVPGTSPTPFTFTLPSLTTINFYISDGDGVFTNNAGGVSLSIAPVPEPATWATLIVGLGLTGLALRRRRKLATA